MAQKSPAQEAQAHSIVLTSLLIIYAIRRAQPVKDRALSIVAELGAGPIASIHTRFWQLDSKSPLFWFKMLRSIRSGSYDVSTLQEFSLISQSDNFVTIRDELNRHLMDVSPYPTATWVMSECGRFESHPALTVLFGPERDLVHAKKARAGERALTVITRSRNPLAWHATQQCQ
jgi:hypothetical protein